MQTIIINTNGLQQIRAGLAEHHKLGGEHFTDDMLYAWASSIEASWLPGDAPAFEIASWDSLTGRPKAVFITPEGYDIEEIEE